MRYQKITEVPQKTEKRKMHAQKRKTYSDFVHIKGK